jgi:hypothetical protein
LPLPPLGKLPPLPASPVPAALPPLALVPPIELTLPPTPAPLLPALPPLLELGVGPRSLEHAIITKQEPSEIQPRCLHAVEELTGHLLRGPLPSDAHARCGTSKHGVEGCRSVGVFVAQYAPPP